MDGEPAPAGSAVTPRAEEQDTPAYRPGYERVAEEILRLIAELRLQPGDRMPTENQLASRLGTSRTVVREAVKILSAVGRVRAQKGRGLFVANDGGVLGSSRWGSFFLPTDLEHVYRLFEFRRVQEAAASGLAATRATPADLRAIEEAAEMCRQGHLAGRLDLFERGDEAFHLRVAEASQNPFLVEAVREARRLQRQSSVIGLHGTVGGHAGEAVAEHAAICRAINDGDAEAAAQAATVHLDQTLEDYRREIRRRVFG